MKLIPVMSFHPKIKVSAEMAAFVDKGIGISPSFAQRLSASFKFASNGFQGHGNSFWAKNDQRNRDLITALQAGDVSAISGIVNNPAEHSLFWGIDGLTRGFAVQRGAAPSTLSAHMLLLADSIVQLAEAVGAKPIWYPEAQLELKRRIDVEQTLKAIDARVGRRIDFPNPFPNEFGIQTSRGVASYRTFQAIYQAWRLYCVSKFIGPRIIEIGPGLGRTAYYANTFGLSDYITIDLPLGNIAQACFIGRALGESAVCLPGENLRAGQIRIETPAWLLATNERFDVALNVDSMTEMSMENATAYAAKIVQNARVFISINHEINAFRVADLDPLKSLVCERFPYWMRKGYSEEHYIIIS